MASGLGRALAAAQEWKKHQQNHDFAAALTFLEMPAAPGRREGRSDARTGAAQRLERPMFSYSTHSSILGLVLALGALISTPALAGSRPTIARGSDDGSLAVELARGVVGSQPGHDVYEGTGETIDLTVPVVVARTAE
jgi:hypothetical protein